MGRNIRSRYAKHFWLPFLFVGRDWVFPEKLFFFSKEFKAAVIPCGRGHIFIAQKINLSIGAKYARGNIFNDGT